MGTLGIVTGMSLLFVVGFILVARGQRSCSRRMDEENRRVRKLIYLDGLRGMTELIFAVKLEDIHESTTQDEIVRIVNLLAIETSMACVNQDKYVRGGCGRDWSGSANLLKIKWSEARKFALKIAPELADRLPHFSEFEPLKSYNAEHLLKKKTK